MNISETWLFLIAATALLGSPGPAIAALLAVGRTEGWKRGLRFYGGLQIGLASAAALTLIGLFSAISAIPNAIVVMSVIATMYLLYLAYQIATSPLGQEQIQEAHASTALAGILLGITNPKAYLAFASLFASFILVESSTSADSYIKWFIVVAVMFTVDIVWLWIGVRLGKLNLTDQSERLLNYVLAGSIVVAAVLGFA